MSKRAPLTEQAIPNYDVVLLVAGSRGYTNYEQFFRALEEYLCLHHPDETVIFITGAAASGPDDMIIRYCQETGADWVEYPADWDDISAPGSFVKKNRFGKLYNAAAGHQRNRKMAEVLTRALIFWDGKSPGTRNMIDECRRVDIEPNVLLVDGDRLGKQNGGYEIGPAAGS